MLTIRGTPVTDATERGLAPDAAARDAALRGTADTPDGVLRGEDVNFVTRGTSCEEQAAVLAVLAQVRAEESQRVRRVERRDRDPWARSQRTPEGIDEVLGG
jgi:hypothetical protein